MSCGIPICGPVCGPSCAIPSCASTPTIPLGSCGFGSGGYGGFGGFGGFGGGAASASSLGTLSGAHVSCINQIPASEVVIQPPAVVLTIPGPILCSSCEPVTVGGYSPCASGSGYGLGSGGYLGKGGICRPRRKYSICGSPC